VVDSTKWGVVGLSSMARLDDIDVLVTDPGLEVEARRAVASRVGKLVLAEPDGSVDSIFDEEKSEGRTR
jgi:DeoR/GlpR family transcriptional regulator of sugar metabolism